MPRDVSTRWNSTFDMLNFAIDYRVAIDEITSNRDLNLRKYELQDEEWVVAKNLRDTLKVCKYFSPPKTNCVIVFLDLQGRDALFFSQHAKHQYSNTCHGPHRQPSCNGNSKRKLFSLNSRCTCNWKANPQSVLQQNRLL
jgi:hypothetical protein